jgi:phosphotriesterase-related protein
MLIDPTGYTYCHEHLHIDLSAVKQELDCRLDHYEKIADEMRELKQLGVSNIIEVTNSFMGRNPQFIEDLIKESGVNVLLSTGYYIEGFFPPEVENETAQQLANRMIAELEVGLGESQLKASVIGEVGSSENTFTPLEQKVFEAAVIAHKETGRPISTHQSMSTMGREQVTFFLKHQVNLERVTIGHCDLKSNLTEILWMIDQGCYVQFDTIGKNSYFPDEQRIAMLVELSKRGLLERVMLSMDITRRSHLKANGGLGFSYLITDFLPRLRDAGINEDEIDIMMKQNPYQLFK